MIKAHPICRWLVLAISVCWIQTFDANGQPPATDVPAPANASPSPSLIRFNRDIRPILSDHCFACHGPDANKRQADLRLDLREAAVEHGAIVPSDAWRSPLIARIMSSEPDEIMPPPAAKKPLSEKQKQLLKDWIEQGAGYEKHWSFTALERPALATSGQTTAAIDAFINQKLTEAHVTPSPRAEPQQLVRRLYLDLIGIPPTPAQLEEWTPVVTRNGTTKLIDHLLASPHYGERMAVPWLDVVRFTDTVGFHGDQNQNIFAYRDYVIRAFNENMPFDQFTIEQLAGDLLEKPTPQQLIATGFNRLNMMTREGGAQPEEYLSKYAADRVRTVGMAWLGATIGCAECHDHKFDPFTAKDFYSLAAYFADLRQWGVYSTYDYTPNPDLPGYSNDHPFPPEIEIVSPSLVQFQQRLQTQLIQDMRRLLDERHGDRLEPAMRQWAEKTAAFLRENPDGWIRPELIALDSDAERIESPAARNLTLADVVELGDAKPRAANTNEERRRQMAMKSRALRYRLSRANLARLRIELLPSSTSQGKLVRHSPNSIEVDIDVVLTRARDRRAAEANEAAKKVPTTGLRVYRAEANRFQPRYVGGQPALGIDGAWKLGAKELEGPATAVYWLDAPTETEDGDELRITIRGDQLAAVRVSVSPFADLAETPASQLAAALDVFARSEGESAKSQAQLLWAPFFFSTQFDSRRDSNVFTLLNEYRRCRDGKTWSMISASQTPVETRILPRGNWQDKTGPVVLPAPPEFLAQPSTGESEERQTRLDLARWIVSRDNPLTARVIVNRLWKQFFGAGLCATVDDLGMQGEPPSHPELLDWLAVELIESGWDIKHIVKLITSSETYSRSSTYRSDLKDIDPANRLLASQNARRLEAEFVRDNVLAIAGLLDCEIIGGPSCKPYQPPGYYANLQFPDRDYVADLAYGQYRRGLYMHWQRTFLHPMLANFDAPSREECIANRVVSNTPQQALTLLNDPSMVEAASVFARQLLTQYPADETSRLQLAFMRAVGRRATAQEETELKSFARQQLEHYQANTAAANQLLNIGLAQNRSTSDTALLAAWTAVCRVLLNLHESMVRY